MRWFSFRHALAYGTSLSAAMVASLAPAAAQAVNPADPTQSEEIVVTASGLQSTIERAPASISVVTRKELETAPFRDLTDALRNVEGVAVTGISNERDIYMRGLPGAYTLILVDGRRQSTRDTRTNGNAGFEQSFLPPVEAIERIEVVRGPMSSLYGSDAIGGVINVITRNVPDRWRGSFSVDQTVQGSRDYGDSNQLQAYLAGPVLSDTVGVQAWGRRLHRQEAGILNAFNGAEDTSLNGRIAVRPAVGHEVVVEAGAERVRRENTAGRTLAANAQSTFNTNDRDHYAAWYDGHFGDATLWASLQQEETQRYTYARNRTNGAFEVGTRAPNVRNRVADARFATPISPWLTGVIGGQYIGTRLIDQNPGRRTGLDEIFKLDQHAAFAEAELVPLSGLSITGGARLDDHEVYGTHWSPRLYAVWEPLPNIIVKGGVTTGFRAPEIRQIAPGYAYVTGGANCTYGPAGTCAVIVGDGSLEAEKSTSYEINIRYNNRSTLNVGLTLFKTDFRDKVTDVQRLNADGTFMRWAEDPNYRLYEWTNIDEAEIRGVEATLRWQPVRTIGIRGSYTYTDSEQKSGNYAGYPLARTPNHMANARFEWTPSRSVTAYAAGFYHGEEINAQLRAGANGRPITTPDGRVVRAYPDYFTADAGVSVRLTDLALMNFAVQNVTDKRLDDLSYNTVNEGRRVWLGLTLRR